MIDIDNLYLFYCDKLTYYGQVTKRISPLYRRMIKINYCTVLLGVICIILSPMFRIPLDYTPHILILSCVPATIGIILQLYLSKRVIRNNKTLKEFCKSNSNIIDQERLRTYSLSLLKKYLIRKNLNYDTLNLLDKKLQNMEDVARKKFTTIFIAVNSCILYAGNSFFDIYISENLPRFQNYPYVKGWALFILLALFTLASTNIQIIANKCPFLKFVKINELRDMLLELRLKKEKII